jgi:hypothetical protein
MDKGIRPFAIRAFMQTLPHRAELGNTEFRRSVMSTMQEAFGLTVLQSATHYNHAFKEARRIAPDQVDGLGRAENKKGGRKRKQQQEELTPTQVEQAAEEAPQGPLYTVVQESVVTVVRAKDGEVVKANITPAEAALLIERAAAQKKARLVVL